MFRRAALAALYALLMWSALASGGYRGWPLAGAHALALVGMLLWVADMVHRRRLAWHHTPLDAPIALLVALVIAQIALGNATLVQWALAPVEGIDTAAPDLPLPLLTGGTISPPQTVRALLVFLTYGAAYILTVVLLRHRRELERFVQMLLALGSVLALLGLLDYLAGEPRLLFWRDTPMGTRRVFGTFANPTHFAAWLGMLVCLGLGYAVARSGAAPGGRAVGERRAQNVVLFTGIAVMALAVLFTLSRGAVVSLVVVCMLLTLVLGRLRRTRSAVVVAVVLGLATVSGVVLVGTQPLVTRLRSASVDAHFRWAATVTSLPMIAEFPVLGTGLGTYIDIYPRYQPRGLNPGKERVPHAHNDLVQAVVEIGLVGAAVAVIAGWRVARDLVGAHLLGRGRCPVGDVEAPRRRDPFSVGLALGGLAAVMMLVLHSAVDFAARIPANGVLAAACLGIATVALHTRFGVDTRHLDRVWTRELGRRSVAAVAAVAVGVAALAVPLILRPVLVEAEVAAAPRTEDGGPADEPLRHGAPEVLRLTARASARMHEATARANRGEASERGTLELVKDAIDDLVASIRLTPTDARLHERLGWAYAFAAHIEGGRPSPYFGLALTHLKRAATLDPENPLRHKAVVDFALSQPEPIVGLALGALRRAVERGPELLPAEVDRLLWLALPEMDWAALVPPTGVDRVRLAAVLDDRRRFEEADALYRAAVRISVPADEPLVRWMYAQFLLRIGKPALARAEAEAGLRRDPDHPELHLARAMTLAAVGEPAALAAYETALARAQDRSGRLPFASAEPLLSMLIAGRLGADGPITTARYRRALAQYLTARGLWVRAVQAWEKVAAESPLNAEETFALGLALEGTGGGSRADETYRRARALDPRNIPIRLRLAQRLWDAGNFMQAVDEWRAIVAETPMSVDARLGLARAYSRMGAGVEAAREYEAVLAIAGDHADAREALALLRQGASRR